MYNAFMKYMQAYHHITYKEVKAVNLERKILNR